MAKTKNTIKADVEFRPKIISLLSAAALKWKNREIAINPNDKIIASKISNELEIILDEIKSLT